jgi:DNA-directed RNA polymerase-5 subunit 1
MLVVNGSILQISTNGKLLVVPYVQFSFSDDNTVLSESVEGLVNVIADSVGFVFLPTVIWVESDATSWVKHL